MEPLVDLFMPCMGEVEGAHGGVERGMAQGALHEAGMHARFEPMGGRGMSEGREGHAYCGDPGSACGDAEGALDTGATPRGSRGRTWGMIPPGGGKEPGGVPRGLPGGTEQREGLGGQGDVPVCGALATMAMDLEALAIHGGDLQEEGVLEPEAQARDSGEGDLMMEGSGRVQEPPDLLHTEDGGKTVGGVRAQERESMPVAMEDVLREEADAAGADAHGGGSEAVDVLPVQAIVLEFWCSDAVRRCVVELRQQPDCTDRGVLGPFALTTELKRRYHVLTSWGHVISPSVR